MKCNNIYNLDCIEGLKKLEANSIDVVVTSPPYNIGVNYGLHDDNLPFEEYLDWMEELGEELSRVLKQEGSLFFNIGDKPSDSFRSMDVAKRIAKFFKLQNTIHWVKHIDILRDEAPNLKENISVGHYKPVNSQRFLNNCHEYIFHFTLSNKVKVDKLANGVPYADKSNIGRWKSAKQDKRARGNMWFIPYKTVQSKKEHPAAYPVELPKRCIKLHGVEDDLKVLDPFMGSGSTAIAAKQLNCNYIGFEIDQEYVKISNENIDMPIQRKLIE